MKLTEGQILWLKLPFGKTDDVSKVYHPYLILDFPPGHIRVIEVGQIDSANNKPWAVVKESNKLIKVDNPPESVLYTNSFIQMDKKIQIEYYEELEKYRDTTDTLSNKKLKDITNAYYTYHNTHEIEDTKSLYFTKSDIELYNDIEDWKHYQKERLTLHGII